MRKRSESEGDFVRDESSGRRDRQKTSIDRGVATINTGRDKAIFLIRIICMARLMDFIKLVVGKELVHGREDPW